MKTLRVWLVWVGCALAACGGAAGVSSNSETHFLGFCNDGDCDDGLSCICGVCTVLCDPAASCGALDPDAICTEPSSAACGDDTEPSVCDVDCDDDGECASLGAGYRCQAGVCRLPGCVYEGKVYEDGATFDAAGCNTCTCTDSGEVVCTRGVCPQSCEYEGETYEFGDEFPAADGCNTCNCSEDGVLCTEIGCPAPVTCEYEGETYQVGDLIPGECNACVCTEAGTLACDDRSCSSCEVDGRVYEHGESFLAEDGCNTCSCDDGLAGCTQIACSNPACLLPFEVGDCDAAIPVFYYNPDTFQCEERTYGGCEGNDNRFATLEECQTSCPEID